jgi:hypothetical protein
VIKLPAVLRRQHSQFDVVALFSPRLRDRKHDENNEKEEGSACAGRPVGNDGKNIVHVHNGLCKLKKGSLKKIKIIQLTRKLSPSGITNSNSKKFASA